MIHTKVVRNATTRVLLLEYELVCIVSIQYGYYYSRVAIMHTLLVIIYELVLCICHNNTTAS